MLLDLNNDLGWGRPPLGLPSSSASFSAQCCPSPSLGDISLDKLKSLTIENYQSHKKTVVKFVSGVNAFIGLGQAGKTAILRAFRLLADNRPLGAKYWPWFADDSGITKVFADFEDTKIGVNKNIRRKEDGTKTLASTEYFKDDERFSGVGKDVPDKIRDALNLSDINFQMQLDAPFLITEQPSAISKIINNVIRLDDVEIWTSKLTTAINSLNKEAKIVEGDVTSFKLELKKVAAVTDEVGALLEAAQKLEFQISDLQREGDDINHMLKQVEGFEKEKRSVESALKHIDDCLERAEHIYSKMLETDDERGYILEYINIQADIERVESEHEAIAAEYIAMLGKLNVCPTCFSDINPKALNKIIKEML